MATMGSRCTAEQIVRLSPRAAVTLDRVLTVEQACKQLDIDAASTRVLDFVEAPRSREPPTEIDHEARPPSSNS